MADLDEKSYFTCHWKIENISLLSIADDYFYLFTPTFRTDVTIHDEEWEMQLYTRNYSKDVTFELISTGKPRKSRGKKNQISLQKNELLVIQDDSKCIGQIKMEKTYVRDGRTFFKFFIPDFF